MEVTTCTRTLGALWLLTVTLWGEMHINRYATTWALMLVIENAYEEM